MTQVCCFATPRLSSEGAEGVVQIRDKVIDIFDADGNADEAIRYAKFGAVFGGHRSVRHRGFDVHSWCRTPSPSDQDPSVAEVEALEPVDSTAAIKVRSRLGWR